MSTVDHDEAPGSMPQKKAVDAILSAVSTITETESISMHCTNTRVLATDIISAITVPPADNSAMDGYALRSANLTTTDRLVTEGSEPLKIAE